MKEGLKMKVPQNISRRISTLLLGLLLAGCATIGHDSSNMPLPRQYTATVTLSPKQYTATASLLVEFPPSYTPQTRKNYLATQIDIISSERVALRVVELTQMDQVPSLREQWRNETDGRGENGFRVWLATALRRQLDVRPSTTRRSNVIYINYRWDNPAFAAAMANFFSRAYIETSLELKADSAQQYKQIAALQRDAENNQKEYDLLTQRLAQISFDNQTNIMVLTFATPPGPEAVFNAILDSRMLDLSHMPGTLEEQPPFTCTHEKDYTPLHHPDADKLFRYANWLMMMNLHSEENEKPGDDSVRREAERLHWIAGAWGHNKAFLLLLGKFDELSRDYGEITIDLIMPNNHFLVGQILDMTGDKATALRHYRKAADWGDPLAQTLLGLRLLYDELTTDDPALRRTGREMLRCAADQGNDGAAYYTALDLQNDKQYAKALRYFQIAVKAGNLEAAEMLRDGFSDPGPDDPHYMNLPRDEERAARYDRIARAIRDTNYGRFLDPLPAIIISADLVVDELDKIVPLPPAELPEWDGKIEWVEKWKRNEPPPLPSEERIIEMALKKGLDPKTGWPLKKDSK